ncbi:hypothetical protein M426DRAFT_6912 [Hypoxylon sp. CI-4A]|nr:hypothetical protein M426DRAFT_6912 [Hypoxylon sp. CI-4A]
MKISTIAVACLSATTGVSASRGFKAIEFETQDCTGWIKHASLGLRAENWQIRTNNDSNSVYTATTNDGIYRWYAFSETSDSGCAGKVLGRLWTGCTALGQFSEDVRCLRWCSTWSRDQFSCQSIGQD